MARVWLLSILTIFALSTSLGAEELDGDRKGKGKTSTTATVVINCNVKGAAVYLNGAKKGAAPLTTEVSAGTIKVKVSASGYSTYSTTVKARGGKTVKVNAKLSKTSKSKGTTPVTKKPKSTTSKKPVGKKYGSTSAAGTKKNPTKTYKKPVGKKYGSQSAAGVKKPKPYSKKPKTYTKKPVGKKHPTVATTKKPVGKKPYTPKTTKAPVAGTSAATSSGGGVSSYGGGPSQNALAFVSGTIGFIGLALGVGFNIAHNMKVNDINDATIDNSQLVVGMSQREAYDEQETADFYKAGSIVGYVVGGVGIGLAILLYSSPTSSYADSDGSSPTFGVAPVPGGGMFTMQGSF